MKTTKPFTINYRKLRDDTGCCYSQTINITQKTLDDLLLKIQAEIILNNKDYYFNLYIKNPIDRQGNIYFLNLTQRDFINKYLKLKLLDRNTCLCVID